MASFSIATTPRYKGAQILSLDCSTNPWFMPRVKQGGTNYHFIQSLVCLTLGLIPCLPDQWRTLKPLCQWTGLYIHIYIYIYIRSHISYISSYGCVCVCVCVCVRVCVCVCLRINIYNAYIRVWKCIEGYITGKVWTMLRKSHDS